MVVASNFHRLSRAESSTYDVKHQNCGTDHSLLLVHECPSSQKDEPVFEVWQRNTLTSLNICTAQMGSGNSSSRLWSLWMSKFHKIGGFGPWQNILVLLGSRPPIRVLSDMCTDIICSDLNFLFRKASKLKEPLCDLYVIALKRLIVELLF